MAEGAFRRDLYYRLSVFPIRLPALRERPSDIPPLVRHFVERYAQRMDKRIEIIPEETMNALVRWEWPGNVRELENFIERSLILSSGPTLAAPLKELEREPEESQPDTIESVQREHIVRTLRETGGVIAGPHGAAARLGMKRTTLQSLMQRLGISREENGNNKKDSGLCI
jgi:formate hydrogenlyase transcriptional activator